MQGNNKVMRRIMFLLKEREKARPRKYPVAGLPQRVRIRET
jgi:hypothetical protein